MIYGENRAFKVQTAQGKTYHGRMHNTLTGDWRPTLRQFHTATAAVLYARALGERFMRRFGKSA